MLNTYTTLSNKTEDKDEYLYRLIMDDSGRTITVSHDAEELMKQKDIHIDENGILSGIASFMDHKDVQIDLFSSSTTGTNDITLSIFESNIVIKFIDLEGNIYRQKILNLETKTINISNDPFFTNFYESFNQSINK